jgi:uncharacterized protein
MRNTLLSIAVLGMASVTYSQVQAAPIQFGGVVPGTVVTKEVQSIRERRFENLIEQETDFSCGAASLATILKYAYGWADVTEETVLEGLMEVADPERVRSLGFSLLDLNNYVQQIGLRGRGYEIEPEALEEVSIPVIVLINLDGYEHFVVMKKARDDRVYIGDPALGNKVMQRDEFVDSWNNIIFAVVGDGFDPSTVLLDPAQPLTAKRMTDVFSPVPKQQLLDFGFKHSELF